MSEAQVCKICKICKIRRPFGGATASQTSVKKHEEATSRHGPQYRRQRKFELTKRRKHSSKVAEVGQLAGLTPSAARTPCTFPGHQGDGLTYDRSHSV